MGFEEKIAKGLERAHKEADVRRVEFNQARYVCFSDHHRGKRDRADDFQRAEAAYHAALGHYLASGYTLCVLGDVEELWECRPGGVVEAYDRTLELEARFHERGDYIRIFGNHDDVWEKERSVRKHLFPFFGDISVKEGTRLELTEEDERIGELFLVHGHQGTTGSDKLRWISKPFVRYVWRPFQRVTGARLNTPAKTFRLRAKHGIAMHSWAASKQDVILIAGHTHKPVFLPEPHVAHLEKELKSLERDGASRDAFADKQAELEWHRVLEASDTSVEGKHCYFNTGCCSFDDGDCTGIEIADGEIRLVRWPDDGKPVKKVLRKTNLREILTP